MNMVSTNILVLFACFSIALGFPSGERMKDLGTPGRCMSENYACPLDNVLAKFDDTQTNEGCRQRCRENIDCNW